MKRFIDLSLDIYDKAPTFGQDPETSVVRHIDIKHSDYNVTRLTMSSHLGTHVDAPFHFLEDGKTVDQLDLSKGIGPARVLDFTGKGAKDVITRADLERQADKVTKGARIIIRTGWDKVFPEESYFTDGPGLDPEACEYLAEADIACLAMDMPSVHGEEYVDAHRILLEAEVLVVEALANLEKLQSEEVFLIVLPLRIRGGDGSPCRAVAVEGLAEDQMRVLGGVFHVSA